MLKAKELKAFDATFINCENSAMGLRCGQKSFDGPDRKGRCNELQFQRYRPHKRPCPVEGRGCCHRRRSPFRTTDRKLPGAKPRKSRKACTQYSPCTPKRWKEQKLTDARNQRQTVRTMEYGANRDVRKRGHKVRRTDLTNKSSIAIPHVRGDVLQDILLGKPPLRFWYGYLLAPAPCLVAKLH